MGGRRPCQNRDSARWKAWLGGAPRPAGRLLGPTRTPTAFYAGCTPPLRTRSRAAGEPNVTNVNDATDGTGDAVLLTRWDGQRWRTAFRIRPSPSCVGSPDVTTAGGHVFAVGGTDQTLAVQN